MPDTPAVSFILSSPKFSFVKFNDADVNDPEQCCPEDDTFCLPFYAEGDLRFQFKIVCGSISDTDAIWVLADNKVQLGLNGGCGNTPIAPNLLYNYTTTGGYSFVKVRTGIKEITYTWAYPLTDFDDYITKCDDCFQLSVRVVQPGDLTDANIFFSNCFVRICDPCYTSLFDYANDDDFAGFRYCNIVMHNEILDAAFMNRVRLPFYFSQPQFPDDETIYPRSDGTRKLLKSNIIKEYLAQTEHFPEILHNKIKVALSHDTTQITGQAYEGAFRKSTPYEITWTDNLCLAPAQFKVMVNPDVSRNSNCQSCQDIDLDCPQLENLQVSTVTDIGGGTETFTFTWDPSPATVTTVNIQTEPNPLPLGDTWTSHSGSPVSPRVITLPIGVYDCRIITSGECFPVTSEIMEIGVAAEDACGAVEDLDTDTLTDVTVEMVWSAPITLPAYGYLWHLFEGPDDTTPAVQYGTYSGGPGPSLTITGLTPTTEYTFRIISHCAQKLFSAPSYKTFTTAS